MKANELTNMKQDELQGELLALLKEQFNLRIQKKIGQLSQTHQLKALRKNIARIKTILNQRQKVG